MSEEAKNVVRGFWRAMAANDFWKASELLAEDYQCVWPQSGEVIAGRRAFAEVNTNYPANGLWTFDVRRLIADGVEVVSEVRISDGTIFATAVTFHEVNGGLIASQWEYWPDPYDPPPWRAQWVEVRNDLAMR